VDGYGGFSVPWALEDVLEIVERRAKGIEHAEVATYCGSQEGRDEFRTLLDEREERPSYSERDAGLSHLPLQWLTTGLLLFLGLTVVLSVSPIPSQVDRATAEAMRQQVRKQILRERSMGQNQPGANDEK
jgi:hypothetical protein